MDDLPRPGPRDIAHRLFDGLVIGGSAGAVIIACVILLFVFLDNKQQETLDAIQHATEANQAASEKLAGSLACDLAAPVKTVNIGGGTQTIRSEGFINAVCLTSQGFEAVDVDGDGQIEIVLDANNGGGG